MPIIADKVKMESDKSKSIEEIAEIHLEGWFTREQVYNLIEAKAEIRSESDIGPKLESYRSEGKLLVRTKPNNSEDDNLLSLSGGPNNVYSLHTFFTR